MERSRQARLESRDQRIREYFYGSAAQFYPHSFEVRFSDVKIFKIGAPALPDSLMPLGMKAEDQLTKLVTVQPSIDFLTNLKTEKFNWQSIVFFTFPVLQASNYCIIWFQLVWLNPGKMILFRPTLLGLFVCKFLPPKSDVILFLTFYAFTTGITWI